MFLPAPHLLDEMHVYLDPMVPVFLLQDLLFTLLMNANFRFETSECVLQINSKQTILTRAHSSPSQSWSVVESSPEFLSAFVGRYQGFLVGLMALLLTTSFIFRPFFIVQYYLNLRPLSL